MAAIAEAQVVADRAAGTALSARCLLVGLRSLVGQGGKIKDDVLHGLPVLEFEGPGEIYVECFGGPQSGEVFIGWTAAGDRLLTRRVQVVKAVGSLRSLLSHQGGELPQ